MRRKDRELVDIMKILSVMQQCQVCHLAFYDEGYPYIIPMNFGLDYKDGHISLYFHGAKEGHKHLLQKNNHVAFSMEVTHGIMTGPQVGACECTMEFESVCGTGIIEYIPEGEKIQALQKILEHYQITEGEEYHFHKEIVPSLSVLKLHVHSVTGKNELSTIIIMPHKDMYI